MSKTTIKLDYPIETAEGKKIDHLTARRVTVGDMRSVASLPNDIEQEIAIIAKITALVPEDVDLLDLRDYKKLQATFQNS